MSIIFERRLKSESRFNLGNKTSEEEEEEEEADGGKTSGLNKPAMENKRIRGSYARS